MIAKRIPTIMPRPSLEEFLEVLNIHSAAGRTLSDGLLGGGAISGPGSGSGWPG